MNDTRSNRFTPVTVGMAISLFMLALVVDKANAWTSVCNQCISIAERDTRAKCAGLTGMQYYICYFGQDGFEKFKKERCYDTKICPDVTEVGSVDCGSDGCRYPQSLTLLINPCPKKSEGAGWICDNSCISMGCGTKSEGKGCTDSAINLEKKNAGKILPSNCFTHCACE